MYIFKSILLALFLTVQMLSASKLYAEGCPARSAVSMFHSCEAMAKVSLDFLPLDFDHEEGQILTVTGAYSSGDRVGVEGLAIGAGQIISKRFQGWDGLLVVSSDGVPEIFQTKNVMVNDKKYNLKTQPDRNSFIEFSLENGFSVIQSHLLIANGALDLSEVPNARKFVRRMIFQGEGGWGIYQTDTAVTLYEAALEIQEKLNPEMALNLDMGAYNFCQMGTENGVRNCGELFAGREKLTNLIRLELPQTH